VIQFLLKGLWRDRTRSLFPFLTVAAGVMLTVGFQAYLSGIMGSMDETSANFTTGHVKVTSRAYAKEVGQSPNELAYVGMDKLLADLREHAPSMTWSPRIRFAGLLDVPDERGNTKTQAPTIGMALDLLDAGSDDRRLLKIDESLVRGRMPAVRGEVLVSDDLARHLSIEPGGTATLISSTMHGSMATSNFTVVGTIRLGMRALDRGMVLADVRDVQLALDMEDAVGEVLGLFPDGLYRIEEAASMAQTFNDRHRGTPDDEFAPVMATMRDQPGAATLMDYINAVYGGVFVAFTLVMSIVLWNAGLVGNLRRYGEVGLRLAFGERHGHAYRMMLAESLAIGLAGSVVGTAIGLIPAYWLQRRGLDISGLMPNSSMMMSNIIRAQISPTTFVIGFVPGLLATMIGTAISGIGVYRRRTATLMKELET
jgi:putative ABC transport system permease protein